MSLRGGAGSAQQPPSPSSATMTCRSGVSKNKRADAKGSETTVEEEEEEGEEFTPNGLCVTRLEVADNRRGGGMLPAAAERALSAVAMGKGAGREGAKEGRMVEATRFRGGMVAGLITKVFHIQRHELSKFLYMSFMMFAIIYVFTMTR